MPKKQPISPRKSPKQSRSRDLVESILTATTRVLMKRGIEGANTNQIAETAGVSVGSLYQYFPNKETLIASLIERQSDRHIRKFAEKAEQLRGRPLEEVVEGLVETLIEVFLRHRKMIRVVYEHSAGLKKVRDVLLARKKVAERVRSLFAEHSDRIRPHDLDHTVFVAVNSIMGVMQTAILDYPQSMTEEDFRRELNRLVLGYLTSSGAA